MFISGEARTQFKAYVNILATVKNENNQKFLLLRKKYQNHCPSEDLISNSLLAETNENMSLNNNKPLKENNNAVPGKVMAKITKDSGFAAILEHKLRQTPPYKLPPTVTPDDKSSESNKNFDHSGDVQNKNMYTSDPLLKFGFNYMTSANNNVLYQGAHVNNSNLCEHKKSSSQNDLLKLEKKKISKMDKELPSAMVKQQQEKVVEDLSDIDDISKISDATFSKMKENAHIDTANPMSVKEATRKFNRLASQEEAKTSTHVSKKKVEKVCQFNIFLLHIYNLSRITKIIFYIELIKNYY